MASRCLSEPGTLVSVVSSLLFDKSVLNTSPATGPLGTRLEENTPSGSIDVPLLVAQGETDNLILPTMQAEYVQQRCDRGGDVDYRTYPGRDQSDCSLTTPHPSQIWSSGPRTGLTADPHSRPAKAWPRATAPKRISFPP
jgi:hypothetical protein